MAKVNLDIASTLDITCRRYDTFKLDMDWTDSSDAVIDLTAYTFKAQVRKRSTSASVVLTFDDSDFTKNATGDLVMNKAGTAMSIKGGNYVYDLQATQTGTGNVATWLKGMFIVNDDVTE